MTKKVIEDAGQAGEDEAPFHQSAGNAGEEDWQDEARPARADAVGDDPGAGAR